MYNKLLLSGACLLAFFATSQTTIFEDNFESGGGNWTLNSGGFGSNDWIVNNAYLGGFFASTPNQPGAITNSPNSNYLHIHNASLACASLSECQALFLAGSGGDKTAMMTNNISTVGMTDVTFDFYYLCGGMVGTTYGNVEYSTNNGVTWTAASPNYAGTPTWTAQSLTNVAWDNQAQLKFRFHWFEGTSGSDPAFSVDQVLITGIAGGGNNITTTNDVTPASWCFNSTETGTVNFNATGTFTAGNVYTAELSDASGSFTAPTAIGTLASTANGNLSINTTMPAGTPAGTGYRVRVVASAPATTGTDNTADLVIHALPSVTLGLLPDVCVYTPSFELTQGSPAGGGYSGNGVVFGFYNAADAGVGSHAVTYTYFDGNGCEGSAMQLINVDACASLDEVSENMLALFPNPTKNTFTLKGELAIEKVEIVDISGKTVITFKSSTTIFDVSSLNSGAYFVRVQTANGTKTVQLIKE